MSDSIRRSQWRVINRCLNLLLCLMRGHATTDDLREIIRQEALEDEHNIDASALNKRFENDKERIKKWFNADIQFDRTQGEYELVHLGRPLLDLPDESVRGLAFLLATFSDDDAPLANEIRGLLNMTLSLLPRERQKQVNNERGLLEMELGARDDDNISGSVWQAVKISTAERRQLAFEYISSTNTDGILRQHTVEPIRYFFDTTRKHYYLESFWLESYAPHEGTRSQDRVVQRFRLGRMQNPHVLPTHFPAKQRIPTKELIYELDPVSARRGVTRHFENMHIVEFDNGGARVHVQSRNLFFDLRTLLRYGPTCRVTGGEDAVRRMETLVRQMHEQYFGDE